MLKNERNSLERIIREVAEELDIPDYAYEDAAIKYEDVSEHLSADDSALESYHPKIYVQGSFKLGTVIRPYGREDEYDIDLVCELELEKEAVTQKDLKNLVGNRIKLREDLKKILKSSRRCWILDYPAESEMPGFHMDVLPSIPNVESKPSGILLTDTELTRWQKSNPIAFAEWFKSCMEVILLERKTALAKSMKASIEDVPDWQVKTPLQRCVQILKRHRDIYFVGQLEDLKPVSIIITTLAAHAYRNEANIIDALNSIVNCMPEFIERKNGEWWVQNPVDKGENFADKWNEYPERRVAFIDWLKKVALDFSNLSNASTIEEGLNQINDSFGAHTIDSVRKKYGLKPRSLLPAIARIEPKIPALGDMTHVQSPVSQFQINLLPKSSVNVSANVYFKKRNGKSGRFLKKMNDGVLPKNVWLKFKAKTNVSESHSIRWQVTNTGNEAINSSQLRGDFYESEGDDNNVRWETTAYRGTHWVEAFVVTDDDICVARSGKVLIKIR